MVSKKKATTKRAAPKKKLATKKKAAVKRKPANKKAAVKKKVATKKKRSTKKKTTTAGVTQRKGGRPTKYTAKLGDIICEGIANGVALATQCKNDDSLPDPRTIYRWLREHEEFCQNYARAREDQADYFAEQIIEIADNEVEQPLLVDGKPLLIDGNMVMVKDAVSVNHAKLRTDTRKWVASKLKPKKYGDKVEIGGNPDAPIKHNHTVEFVGVNASQS